MLALEVLALLELVLALVLEVLSLELLVLALEVLVLLELVLALVLEVLALELVLALEVPALEVLEFAL